MRKISDKGLKKKLDDIVRGNSLGNVIITPANGVVKRADWI